MILFVGILILSPSGPLVNAQPPTSSPTSKSSKSTIVGPLASTLQADALPPFCGVPAEGCGITVATTACRSDGQPFSVASTQ